MPLNWFGITGTRWKPRENPDFINLTLVEKSASFSGNCMIMCRWSGRTTIASKSNGYFFLTLRKLSQFESASHRTKGERGIWQRRFWEHEIRDEKDFINHIDYIHYNPVKHGYVKSPADWSYSSIHKYIERDELLHDWGSEASFDDEDFGEWTAEFNFKRVSRLG